MFRIAIQVKELISSNVTSAIDSASNPAKMLARLQREIEEALVGLHGEVSKARRQKDRLEVELTQAELREADWSDKAQIAMDNGREDLARQALMAREDCRAGIERMKQDIDRLSADIAEMEASTRELEDKREDVRQRHAIQTAADGNASGSGAGSGYASRAERRMDHIETLEKRTAFTTDDSAASCANASVEREIDEMRRERMVDEELAAMRKAAGSKKAPAKKGGKRSKAA